MNMSTAHFAGWTAVIGGIVGIIGFIALALLFVVGEPFGTLNDILSIPTALLMMPLIFALYRLNGGGSPAAGLIALLAGVTGFLAAAVGSGLLVLGRLDFVQSLIPGIGGFGLIGLWVLVNSVLGLTNGVLPRGLAWTGIALSVTPSLALLAVFRAESLARVLEAMGGQASPGVQISPLAYAFLILGAVSYAAMPVFYIVLGRLFLSNRLAFPIAASIA